jgi:hypothetical protein
MLLIAELIQTVCEFVPATELNATVLFAVTVVVMLLDETLVAVNRSFVAL